jgi:hypothetical protein
MTPATSSFSDAALPVGATFMDSETGTSITAASATSGALTIAVSTPLRPTFADVPITHPFYQDIETSAWNGITRGCASNPRKYCPDAAVSRAEMAVFLERAMKGSSATFAATGTTFSDVPATHWAAGWIEQLYKDGITGGCANSPLRYCPDNKVTRAEMAVFLLRARLGSNYKASAATGNVFADVPKTHWAAAWIETFRQLGFTGGCASNPLRYCPESPVTRGQMAVFIKRVFSLTGPPV